MTGWRQVQRLHIGVAAVLRVPTPVVVERHALVQRIERTPHLGRLRRARRQHVRRLVDVVAEVQEEVDVVALGDARVRVEEAGVVARARHDGEAKVLDATVRAGCGSGQRATTLPAPRTRSSRSSPARARRRRRARSGPPIGSDAAVPLATTSRSPSSRATRHVSVDRLVGVDGHSRPQHHPILERIAARHRVTEQAVRHGAATIRRDPCSTIKRAPHSSPATRSRTVGTNHHSATTRSLVTSTTT